MNELVQQEELMDQTEYLNRAMEVTDLSLRDVVNDKAKAYQRLRGYMGRNQLAMAKATPVDVLAFLNKYKRIIGKLNETDGKGFKIYDSDDPNAVNQILEDAPDVLEEYIVQHPRISEIYNQSVNTLRIHTIRNEREIRTVFLPLLSIGAAGSITDHPICNKALRILLAEDGTIISGVDRWKCYEKMDCHPDTGYRVIPGEKLPYVREASELCLKAALRFPELRYLGWDVAITENGPVIVEVNGISGLAPKYCRSEDIIEMFRFASSGVEFCYDPLFRAKRFVPDIEEIPDTAETYMLCLQSALHRRGIEFTNRNDVSRKCGEEIECIFALAEQGNSLSVQIKGVKKIEFSLDTSYTEGGEHDLFSIEIIAAKRADEIYSELRKATDSL